MLALVVILMAPAPTAPAAFDRLSAALEAGDADAARELVTDDCWYDLSRPCAALVNRLATLKKSLGRTHLYEKGDRAAAPVDIFGHRHQLLFRQVELGWLLDDHAREPEARRRWVDEKQPRRVGESVNVPFHSIRFARRLGERAIGTQDGFTWLLLHHDGGLWKELDRTASRTYAAAYLKGLVRQVPFDVAILPGDPAVARLMQKVGATISAGGKSFPEVDPTTLVTLERFIARKSRASVPKVHWLATTRRALVRMDLTYNEGGERYDHVLWFRATRDRVHGVSYDASPDWLFGSE